MEDLDLRPEDYLNMAQSLVAGVLEQCGAQCQIKVALDRDTGGFLIEMTQVDLFYQIRAWVNKGVRDYTFSTHKRSHFNSRKGRPNRPIEIMRHSDFLGILVTLKKTLEAKR